MTIIHSIIASFGLSFLAAYLAPSFMQDQIERHGGLVKHHITFEEIASHMFGPMSAALLDELDRINPKELHIFYVPGPFTLAAVCGMLGMKTLFIDQKVFYQNRDRPECVAAILAHEAGHVRHGHLWLNVLFVGLFVWMPIFESMRLLLQHSVSWALLLWAIPLLFMVLRPWIRLLMEKDADEYVVKTGLGDVWHEVLATKYQEAFYGERDDHAKFLWSRIMNLEAAIQEDRIHES